MKTTVGQLLAACKEALECATIPVPYAEQKAKSEHVVATLRDAIANAEVEQAAQVEAVAVVREIVRVFGGSMGHLAVMRRACLLIDALDGTEGYAIYRDGALVRPADAEAKFVVYMLGKSGDKKYDPAEFSYFHSFDKPAAKRMTEDEARKRVHELGSTYAGRATFRYEPADDDNSAAALRSRVVDWNEIR